MRLLRIMNFAPELSSIAVRAGAQLVHAWGPRAAAAAGTRLRNLALLVSLLKPQSARETATWLRSLAHRAVVAAGSQTARGLLVGAGAAPDRVVVIRGAVDFGEINRARSASQRAELVGEAGPVLLMDGPASRGGGQYYGIWAAAIVRQVCPELRVLMPYGSRERDRLRRFARDIRMEEMFVCVDAPFTWAQLMACCDAFVCPAVEEACGEPLAMAMAAGVPIVASAVRSVTELVADRHNGFLCKPARPRDLAGRMLTAIEDADTRRQVTEVARGQAYEVFGQRSFIDHYERLYENVIQGRAPGDGIRDNAMVA